MKKVFVSGVEEIINALQSNKVLYLDTDTGYIKYWMYKGLICTSIDECAPCKIGLFMSALPEYKYYYYENGVSK